MKGRTESTDTTERDYSWSCVSKYFCDFRDFCVRRVRPSIRMMTANFKRFRLKPTGRQGQDYNDGTPFVKALMDKALEGVHVQVVCSRPSPTFQEEWRGYYRQLNPELFE